MIRFAVFVLAAGMSAQTPQAPSPTETNAGRRVLTAELDHLAAEQTAARRQAIARITTRSQALARKRHVHDLLIKLLGGPLPAGTPLNPRITGSSVHDGIRIERVLFDSQPNFPVTALLYLPEAAALKGTGFNPSTSPATTGGASAPEGMFAKLPAILMAPGHAPSGKAGDAATALLFAHAGFAVLSYDPIGQGERLQYPDPADPGHTLLKGPTGEHGEAGLQPTLIGDAVARYFLIDAVRAIDYLVSRSEIDPHRIGAFGCSGGGLMTALTAALDPRIAVAGVACFTTSFDTLLPSIGPQDSEQSTPNFIASGLDFPDWSELFAPKPYAIIATTEDMFPFAGAQSTEREARRFYGLLHAQDNLAFITGPGHHGHLQPIMPEILAFFVTNLHATPDATGRALLAKAADPIHDDPNPPRPAVLPTADTQVTPTSQVSTSYPGAETVYTLNLKRASEKLATPSNSQLATGRNHPRSSALTSSKLTAPPSPPSLTLPQLQRAIRDITHAKAHPQSFLKSDRQCSASLPDRFTVHPLDTALVNRPPDSEIYIERVTLHEDDGSNLPAILVGHENKNAHPGVLLLVAELGVTDSDSPPTPELLARMRALAKQGSDVLAVTPRPSPPGTEETKSPILGPFYLTELRAELVGKTLMGLRLDDISAATDYLAESLTEHVHMPNHPVSPITAEASGHMALVLLHAAVLDPRLAHITLYALPATYTELLHELIPHDAPQDILPGVLLRYDTPDLIRVLGRRVTVTTSDASNF